MLRHLIRRNSIRFYHDARQGQQEFRHVDKRPTAKLANSRLVRINRGRRDSESPNKVSRDQPTSFEPFPFAVTEENRLDCLRKAIAPLHDVPLEEQLSSKASFCRNALRMFAQELYRDGTPVRMDARRLPCQVRDTVPSPVQTNYRNRDEFSIWRGYDGKTITAGHMIFPIGKHGDTVCVEPNGIEVMREVTNRTMDLVQEFLRNHAKLGVCYSLGTDGGWRRFMVRNNLQDEVMLVGVLSPRTLRVRDVLEERDNFREFMMRRSQETGLKLASLYYQPCPNNRCSHRDVPFELLHGSKTIVETVGTLKVHLSPESYIHHNTLGAQTLYETVQQVIKDCFQEEYDALGGVKPLIINIESGCGLMGLHLANLGEQVVGIDRNEQAVDDARANVKLNQVDNVEFVVADAEIVLQRVLEKYNTKIGEKRDVLVVADLTSSGLHRNIVEMLKGSHDINKIVLVMPKLDTPNMLRTMMDLCSRSSTRSMPPFAPILAVPVDVTPQTTNFQTILVLERLQKS